MGQATKLNSRSGREHRAGSRNSCGIGQGKQTGVTFREGTGLNLWHTYQKRLALTALSYLRPDTSGEGTVGKLA